MLCLIQVALQTNTELLQLPDSFEASDSAAILAQVSADLNSPAETTRLEALHWVSHRLLILSHVTESNHVRLSRHTLHYLISMITCARQTCRSEVKMPRADEFETNSHN